MLEKEDIPLLVEHFAQIIADEQGNAVRKFDDKTIKALQNFSWTGNIVS